MQNSRHEAAKMGFIETPLGELLVARRVTALPNKRIWIPDEWFG